MVESTIRSAASALGTAFRKHHRESPMHLPGKPIGRSSLLDPLSNLFKAFGAGDPPPNRQAAITPEFLREVDKTCRNLGPVMNHTADLMMAAYFFAMRACEYVSTSTPGRTRRITLSDIIFRDSSKRVIPQNDPLLLKKASYVTIIFRDQKNGRKMDRRTQSLSGDPRLCPVRGWGRAVRRILASFPDAPPTHRYMQSSDGEQKRHHLHYRLPPAENTTSSLQDKRGKGEIRIWTREPRYKVHPIRSSHGIIPYGSFGRKDQDHWKMVQRCIHGIHSTASTRMDQHHGPRHGTSKRVHRPLIW